MQYSKNNMEAIAVSPKGLQMETTLWYFFSSKVASFF